MEITRMKIPQPIQLWFNELSAKSADLGSRTADDGFIATRNKNPFLIIGIENLIMETVSVFPLPKDAAKVIDIICKQLLTFYKHSSSIVREITLELLPSLIYVYFRLTAGCRSEFNEIASARSDQVTRSQETAAENEAGGEEKTLQTESHISPSSPGLRKTKQKETKKIQFPHLRSSIYLGKPGNRIHIMGVEKSPVRNNVKSFTDRDAFAEYLSVINLLEKFFLDLYNFRNVTLLGKQSTAKADSQANQPIHSVPTLYSDTLEKANEKINTELQKNTTKNKPTDADEPVYGDCADICWKDIQARPVSSHSRISAINGSNQMCVLTYLLKCAYTEHENLPSHTKTAICRLAVSLGPQCHNDDSYQRPAYLASEQNASQSLDEEDTSALGTKECERVSFADLKIGKSILKKGVKETTVSTTEFSHSRGSRSLWMRIQTVNQEFVLVLLNALARITYPSSYDLITPALNALQSRAEYELWSQALLVVNALKRKVDEAKQHAVNNSVATNSVPKRLNIKKKHSLVEMDLQSEQLSLAGAYCGLWTDLLERRGKKFNQESKTESSATMSMVKVAQNKFMQSLVTNANFRTAKPPDDITVNAENSSAGAAVSKSKKC